MNQLLLLAMVVGVILLCALMAFNSRPDSSRSDNWPDGI